MTLLSGNDFRKKFISLFQIDPFLSNIEAYSILRENSFDVPNTCLDVAQRAGKRSKKEEFWIPQRTLSQLELSGRLRRGRSTPNSPPEIFYPNGLKSVVNNKFPSRRISKVKVPKVKRRGIDSLEDDDSDDEEGSVIIVDETPIDREISGQKRSFSDFEISEESDAVISSSESDIDYTSQSPSSRSIIGNRPVAARKKRKSTDSKKSGTRTTPWISKIAGEIFGRPLEPIRTSADEPSGISALKGYREAISLARSTAEEFLCQSQDELTEYRAGDSILVQLEDIDSNYYYARIVYLFTDEDDESMAHIRYFRHGYSTVIGKIASPRELFLTFECADISMDDVKGKIKVDFRGKNHNLGISGIGNIEEEYYCSTNRYFYRLNYDITSESFTEASELAIQEPGTPLEDYECSARHEVEENKKDQRLKVLDMNRQCKSLTSLIYNGREYHRNDFVYFVSKATLKEKKPYHIGQIQYIRVTTPENSDSETETGETENESDINLMMDVYERYDDHFQIARSEEIKNNIPFAVHDERRVFLREFQILNPESLDGHCFVMHKDHIEDIDTYKNLDDTFWVQDQIPRDAIKESITVEDLKLMPGKQLRYSKESTERLRLEKERMESRKNGVKLTTLCQFTRVAYFLAARDIFSGAGGLSQGFHESGVVGTTYAIEFDSAACKTLKRNFPDAIVYNVDANKLLECVVKNEAGLSINMPRDREENTIAVMPKKGEVHLIIGGPPCQGWSSLNRRKKKFCDRRELIATYLSYVDFYRPQYFLLENVMGLVNHKLDCAGVPDMDEENDLPKGGVKFIFRALTSLGYQCQYAYLQAGVYGSPSSRTRVIFWASLPGCKLPKFPHATHVFNGRVMKSPHRTRRSAPHHPVTIGDCISDLPLFEWMNPHMINPETPAQRSDRLKREKNISHYRSSEKSRALGYIGLPVQAYHSDPISEYQRKLRKSVHNQLVQNHTTNWLSTKDTERICNIPLQAGASYKDMPENLLPDFLQEALENSRRVSSSKDDFRGRFGRQSVDQSFKVITTSLKNPMSVDWSMHPFLHRGYSAREFARAQGFPDSFTWDESTQIGQIYTQIGNAVPIPLARALANELSKVLQDKTMIISDFDHGQDMDAQEDIEEFEPREDMDQDTEVGEDINFKNSVEQNTEEEKATDTSDEETDNKESEVEENMNSGGKVIEISGSDDEENIQSQDEIKQSLGLNMRKKQAMDITRRHEGVGMNMNTGESRDDAIVLDESD